ncbi:glycoside hydrolase family 125 protein [Luteolibacter yonseiensis]|uniref:Glycoside hydrolase family 125 protein n=1 Tax=Luteolibacter yonseiensis TaxID=1144680 RepID=A0A934R6P5_9BACT|nr:glycoside hydrolase family 125 protein [Luteolibacter yonseiensis]MBK1817231.1 glycoside hydrolase family 125 protein [Luteolibacter yonseiensis]
MNPEKTPDTRDRSTWSRRNFMQRTALAASALALAPSVHAADAAFPVVRTPVEKRKFKSAAIDAAIEKFKSSVGNKELGWLFENCFPNTLDTTVEFKMIDGRPDTYVITGDIDAMWLRDSSAQVYPYLHFIKEDKPLKDLIAGVINRQTRCILKDPYANAFYENDSVDGHWKDDMTDMKPGVHERKWEIDSLCYPIRLAYEYWKTCGDVSPFDEKWREAIKLTLKTFIEQQRKNGKGPYHFMRKTEYATDSLPGRGYGNPAKPVGLIYSAFRPSDDATIFPFLIPSNFFAMVSLRQAAEMVETIVKDKELAGECRALADEVEKALAEHAIVHHPKGGKVYAFEVDAFGNFYCTDDGNIPNLLSLPYLGAVKQDDEIYLNTRKLLLSDQNPYWCIGKAANGLGGPHVGVDMIWPLGVIVQALTATDDAELKGCIETLRKTHADTGFMHEAFHKDDPKKFTRSWFAWANTIFGELLWTTYQKNPKLLD